MVNVSRISVTALSSYDYCKRKLFIQDVLGIRPPVPPEAVIRGNVRHKIHEKMALSDEEIIKSVQSDKFEDIFALFRKKYLAIAKEQTGKNRNMLEKFDIIPSVYFKEIWPQIEGEANYRASLVFEFVKKKNLFGEELWNNLTPKLKPEYKIFNEALGLVGKIDQLEVYEHFCVPVELKTGSTPKEGVWPNHKIQVGAYALLMQEHFKTSIERGVVRYLDSNTARTVVINPFLINEVKEQLKKVRELLKSTEIPEKADNPNKCEKCDLKDVCFDEKLIKEKTKHLNRN